MGKCLPLYHSLLGNSLPGYKIRMLAEVCPAFLSPRPLPCLLHPGMAPTELAQWSALWEELG